LPREIAPQSCDSTAVARPSENPFVGRQAASAYPKIDERPTFAIRKPDDARPAVWTRRRVIRVDESRVRNTLVALGRERVRVADGGRCEVTLLVSVAEECFDPWSKTAVGAWESLSDNSGELR
jgi:hypothetical protein